MSSRIDKGTRCYVCDSRAIYVCDFASKFTVYECKGCGLKWVGGITKDTAVSFYDNEYFNSDSKMGYQDYLGNERNHRRNARSILSIVDKKRDLEGLRVLDVGCAFGFLLDEAKKFRCCDVYGLELNHDACEYAKGVLSLKVFNGEVESSCFPKDFFDVVFVIGTIEHLISPKDTLRAINMILKPEGLLVITTLNTRGLFPFYSIKPPEHLFYFNHDNIDLLLNRLNFRLVKKKTHFSYYCLPDLFHRLSEFLTSSFLRRFFNFVRSKSPNIDIKIPTNEMLLIAQKSGVVT